MPSDVNRQLAAAPPFDAEALYSHPDFTPEVDALDDPVREIAEDLFGMGAVVRGKGFTRPQGASVRFGPVVLPNILIPGDLCEQEAFGAVSWEAAMTVYRNPGVFSSKLFERSVGAFWGPALSTLDPPEHTKYRAVMQRGFTPKLVQSYEDSIIRPILNARFDAIKRRGRADLVRELDCFYPYEIVGRIVGFEASDIAFVASCFTGIWSSNVNAAAATEAGYALREYSRRLIETRRREPRDDLVSAMLEAEIDGEPLRELNLIAMVNHLMAAGIDTTYKQSGNVAHTLLSHPEQFEVLKRNRDLIPDAVEEVLRYEGIGGIIGRQALEDFDLCGVRIPKGKVVFLMAGVSDRDPSRWTNPHAFDIRRKLLPHLQFANGPHACIGQYLARFMLALYVEHLIDDLPNLRWDSDTGPIPKITGWTQRTPLRLPVVWDP